MTAILNAILAFVRQIPTIISIVSGIQTAQAAQATADQTDAIKADTEEIKLKINDSVFGLAAIQAQLATFQAQTALDVTAILTAIGTPLQVGDPIIVTELPPVDITEPAAELVASTVWNFDGPTTGFNAIDLLEDAAVPPIAIENWATTHDFHQLAGWEFYPATNIDRASPAGSELLPLDFSTVLSSDATAVDWLNRVWGEPHFVDGGGGAPSFTDDFGNQMFVPWLQTPTFEILRDRAVGLTAANTAPVWPGLAGVTLGTPVPLSTGLTVAGPMHGALILLTSVPAPRGFYLFDTSPSYLNIGALAFFSDNGDEEHPQNLGFITEVYLPKSMVQAAGVKVRTATGVAGTITPFTIP